ncbi:MAG: HAMP domain-containing histidine kinase [Cyclobacteriaceae bacterium]|nr:HAMP domain-containing histidine kinase [Cyclobacteriaceae bacterium]
MSRADRDQQEQFKRINTRLLMLVSLAIILLVAYFTVNNYYSILKKSKEEVLHRLMAISNTAALLIDGDAHERLSIKYVERDAIVKTTQDSLYASIQSLLTMVSAANHLSTPLYTIVYFPPDSTFHFIATSSETPYFRHSYKNYPRELLVNLETGGVLDSYEDENGKWLSAFSPIKNSEGNVVALLEADENFELFLARAKTTLLQNLVISLLIVIPFGFLLYNYISNTLAQQAAHRIILISQKEEIESKNELIENQKFELDRRVKERTAELNATHLELSNFLYHSSHDVQAPIATLKGLQILACRELKDGTGKQYLKLLGETIAKLERIIKTIKLVHEIKTTPLSVSRINLRNCIIESIEQAIVPLCKTSINVDPTIEIQTDKALLKTSLIEMFKNCHQYRSLEISRPLKVLVTAEKVDQQIKLSIEDNGEGIALETRKDLFAMFRRGHEKSTGIGLGLYITRTCLERINGEISVADSQELEGTRFIATLHTANI